MQRNDVPFQLGYRLPSEWERHDATWISWPKDPLTFPPEIIDRVEQIYLAIVRALQKGERLEILVEDDRMEERVAAMLVTKENVNFRKLRTADVWVRDYGPIIVKKRGEIAATKWIFNAWGGKYDELLRDNLSGAEICQSLGVKVFEPNIVLEGGSIDVNGRGSCLTTKQCLLNKNRNPELGANYIEAKLHDYLGITNLIWLGEGISGDDTDGHVDDIARFVNENTVVCMMEENPNDENYTPLQKNYELLKQAKDQDGNPLEILTLNMPGKVDTSEGRLPASYANFYVGNSAVLVPIFGDKNDDPALAKLAELYPTREVVGINCLELVYGFGGIHCVTQQQPSIS